MLDIFPNCVRPLTFEYYVSVQLYYEAQLVFLKGLADEYLVWHINVEENWYINERLKFLWTKPDTFNHTKAIFKINIYSFLPNCLNSSFQTLRFGDKGCWNWMNVLQCCEIFDAEEVAKLINKSNLPNLDVEWWSVLFY